ncbi:DNA/RNA polymerase [Hymenopellis radicata]|nr:DNA/RNA polymerase [Hymenopellis radicata]
MSGSPVKPWKGKAKAADTDFDDLDPVITYRQLYSQTLGVRDPLRVIALCDSDAFYAACEMVRLGVTDQPLVVLQWESIIAVNYPARKFGISRMDKIKDAKARCPELMVIHVATYKEGEKEPGYWENVDSRTHKVSLDYYRRESMKILGMFKEMLLDAEIEKASIDEAFIDFTKPVRAILLQRYPYLAELPKDAPNGMDTALPPPPQISWDNLGFLIPVDTSPSNDTDTNSTVQPDHPCTWHDVALAIAAQLMHDVREAVRTKLGYTLSAGIARNKFLAKLSASYRKPNSQSILRNSAIPNYLKPMAFQKIRFLGGKLGDALAKEYDVSNVEDLLSVSLEEMQQKFGEGAIWVYEILRGIDRTEVKAKSAVNKSMLASKNLPQPITKASEGHHWIRVLAAELALRLKDAREANPTSGQDTGSPRSERSKQAAFPFNRDFNVDVIAAAGDKLWKDLVGSATTMKVTSVQLAFTGIETAESGLQSIAGFLGTKRTREEDGADSDANDAKKVFFVCSRCNKEVRLPTSSISGDETADDAALEEMKMEHSDWHFAQDLSKEADDPATPREPLKEPVKKKKRVKEPPKKQRGYREIFYEAVA